MSSGRDDRRAERQQRWRQSRRYRKWRRWYKQQRRERKRTALAALKSEPPSSVLDFRLEDDIALQVLATMERDGG